LSTPRPAQNPLLEWARRRAGSSSDGGAVDDIAAGGLPRSALDGLLSFYEAQGEGVHVCDGTSCHFSGGPALADAVGPSARAVRCLGYCYQPPVLRVGDAVYAGASPADVTGEPPAGILVARAQPTPRCSLVPPVVLRAPAGGAVPVPDSYGLPGGDAILSRIAQSGLRGRGGAAFATAEKWRAARDTPSDVRYVIANGDEGDPGSFVDRVLLEEDPHAVLAGMQACARVIGAARGIVFVRGEYPRARATMAEAIREATDRGLFDPDFQVEVFSGAGSYVCGEETAMLRAIEGLRGEPSPKPPYPATHGLHGKPTVIQNVETLAVARAIVAGEGSGGTKVASVSGAVRRPGLVEFALGTTLREVLEAGAGGASRPWKMAVVGGPMGAVVPAERFDVELDYRSLPGLGHAGIVVLDAQVSARALAEHLFAFAVAESCGSCTPCRVGTSKLAGARDAAALERLFGTLEIGSLCGFGQGVPRPLRDLLAAFPGEMFP